MDVASTTGTNTNGYVNGNPVGQGDSYAYDKAHLNVRKGAATMSAMGTDESVNYSGSSRSERGAQNFLPANLERQLHFQIRTLAPRVQNQESRAKGSFNSSWFWGRQCPLMADRTQWPPAASEYPNYLPNRTATRLDAARTEELIFHG